MYLQKPVEQLFDLQEDPYETNNLIGENGLVEVKENLRERLDDWMVKHRDTGLLNEGDMMMRAKADGTSVYELAREYTEEDYRDILNAAKEVGKIEDISQINPYLGHRDSMVRFWGLVAVDVYPEDISGLSDRLVNLMEDDSPAVAIKAAEIGIRRAIHSEKAYKVLEKALLHEYEPLVLQAAISTRQLEEKALPLLPVIQNTVMPKYSGEIWGRYRSWSYPMFIGMALDQAQINCGVSIDTRR
jgi:uncharacterized sulfatase